MNAALFAVLGLCSIGLSLAAHACAVKCALAYAFAGRKVEKIGLRFWMRGWVQLFAALVVAGVAGWLLGRA